MISRANQIIEHRETVAGVAFLRSFTSKTKWMLSGTASLSPFGSVRHLLSSSTEFNDSIHSGSMYESKHTTYCFLMPLVLLSAISLR